MNQPHQSKRIRELIFQINKYIERVQNPPKSEAERLKDIKRLYDLRAQLSLQRALEAPTKEDAKNYLEKHRDISVSTKGAVLLEKEIDPPPERFLTGEDALSVISYPPKKFYSAVRHYSADTDHPNSYYRLINTSLRKNQQLKDSKVIQARNDLIEMFEFSRPIGKPIRLYRGISVGLAELVSETGFYSDDGFSSFSSDLGVAIAYSGISKSILILDLDEGSKGLFQIGDISRNSHEREVLFQQGSIFELANSKISSEGFRLLYLNDRRK